MHRCGVSPNISKTRSGFPLWQEMYSLILLRVICGFHRSTIPSRSHMRPLSVLRSVMILNPMSDKLTNLLPLQHQRLLIREYYFRLGVVVIVMVSTLTIVATVLLVPTYVFLIGNANAKEAHLASMRAASSSPDDKAFSSRLTILSKETSILMALANAPSGSEIIRSVLAFSRPGITLSGLTYTPLTAKNPGTVAISGRALTRDALR